MKTAALLRRQSVLIPAAAATAVRTANINTIGAHNAVVAVHLGAELNTDSTNVKVTLSEADATSDAFTTWDSTLVDVVVDNTAATIKGFNVPLQGRKKFLRLTVTPDSTSNGPVVSSAHVDFDDEVRS